MTDTIKLHVFYSHATDRFYFATGDSWEQAATAIQTYTKASGAFLSEQLRQIEIIEIPIGVPECVAISDDWETDVDLGLEDEEFCKHCGMLIQGDPIRIDGSDKGFCDAACASGYEEEHPNE